MITAAHVSCIFEIRNLIANYVDQPFLTVTSTESVKELAYPVIRLCSSNPINKSKFLSGETGHSRDGIFQSLARLFSAGRIFSLNGEWLDVPDFKPAGHST